MAREARLHLPEALYHVSLHANAKQDLFLDKYDAQYFCRLLSEGQHKYGHQLLAFCFLGDHVHLAIKIAKEPLSKIMHNLTFRYTRHFNHRNQRLGHLFVGRYKATIVQAEKYLPDLIRYIHLSPVRLGFATKPEDYLWSSHRNYLGKENLAWVDKEELLKILDEEEYSAYIALGMQHGRPKDLAAAKFNGRVFGDEHFIRQTLNAAEKPRKARVSLEELLMMVCHEYAITEEELISPGKQRSSSIARGVLAYLVKQSQAVTFSELAKRMNRDATTLSAHAVRIEKQQKNQPKMAAFIHRIKTAILV